MGRVLAGKTPTLLMALLIRSYCPDRLEYAWVGVIRPVGTSKTERPIRRWLSPIDRFVDSATGLALTHKQHKHKR
jgi:hypothetical protein